jgi:hypothetical protein
MLFIDIDGVLHPGRQAGSLGPTAEYMRVGPLGWLAGLAELMAPHPDVGVVVHSSWRLTYSLDELREMLGELGSRNVDVTPPGERYASILKWLRVHPGTQYLILDDDATEFPQPAPKELVVCDPGSGVSGENVRQVLLQWLRS